MSLATGQFVCGSTLFKFLYLFFGIFGGSGGSLLTHCHSLVVLKSE